MPITFIAMKWKHYSKQKAKFVDTWTRRKKSDVSKMLASEKAES